MNILVATDPADDNDSALLRATQLSQLSGGRLHVLHVTNRVPLNGKPDEAALAYTKISDQIRDTVERNVTGSSIAYEVYVEGRGRVHEAILEHARTLRADLVVIGRSTRPDVLPDSVFLTTGHVIESSSAPVLVVTQPPESPYRHILLEASPSISLETLLTPIADFGSDMRLTLLINADLESQASVSVIHRLMGRSPRSRCERYVARALSILQKRGFDEDRVSLDIVERNFESVLRSKLRDKKIDVVGLTGMRQKLRKRESGRSILADFQVASNDILTRSGDL